MVQEYEHSIFQGEAFYLEFVLRDEGGEYEDLDDATPSVVISDGITESDVTVLKTGDPGSVEIMSLSAITSLWPIGVFDIQFILSWLPVDTVDVERILTVRLTIKEAL